MKNIHTTYRQSQKGSSTLEILIAFTVLIVAIIGATMVAFGGQVAGLDTGLTNQGLYRSATVFDTQVAAVSAYWDSATTTDESNTTYTHTTDAIAISPCMKLVSAGVSWMSDKDRIFKTGLQTLTANILEARKLGGDCDPFPPSSNWDAPSSYPISDPIFSGSEATDVDAIHQSGRRLALVTTKKNPSPGGEETFWVIDVTDLDADPLPSGSLETPDDLFAVDATNGFAFAVGATSTNQMPLQVIDISDKTNPSLAAEAALPNADTGGGRSVYYYNDKVYVGTQYLPCPSCTPDINNEFHIFDVSTPSAPIWEASIDVQRNVNDIVVKDGLAYLATGPGGDNTVLKIYDVDPLSPTYLGLVGSYAATSAQSGTALYLLNKYVYLGRERTTGSHADFLAIDVANPSVPSLTDSLKLDLNNNTAVHGVAVKGNIAFIVTSDQTASNGGGPFIMVDVRDPSDIQLIPPCGSINWAEKATGLDMIDNYAFVSNESNDALQVIYPTLSCTP